MGMERKRISKIGQGDEMRLLKEKIEELNSINKNWIDVVQDELNNKKEPSDQELVKLFNELWPLIREALKKDYNGTVEILQTQIEGDSGWLIKEMRDSLDVFFALDKLREMQKDKEKCKAIVQYFLDNVILFFDPQFVNEYATFGFEAAETFLNAARSIDGLIGYYVSRHYTKQAIRRDLEEETGLEEDICEYISDWITQNYHTLQINVFMDMFSANDSVRQ